MPRLQILWVVNCHFYFVVCNNKEKEADNGLQDQRVWSPEECADIFSQRFVNPFHWENNSLDRWWFEEREQKGQKALSFINYILDIYPLTIPYFTALNK